MTCLTLASTYTGAAAGLVQWVDLLLLNCSMKCIAPVLMKNYPENGWSEKELFVGKV